VRFYAIGVFMYIDKLIVKNFRNIKKINIDFNKNVNIFYGDNAQGKTSILEGIYFCATGRSHKTHIDKEIINFDESEAHLELFARGDTFCDKINVHLKKNMKKWITVNSMPIRKIGELFGVLSIVLFAPEDLQLVKSGPSERRRFVDLEMCQLSKIYYYDLKQYHKILKQRNNLLKEIQKDKNLKETLFVWDSQLINFGAKVIKQRQKFIEEISGLAGNVHSKITGGAESLGIVYRPSVLISEFEKKIKRNTDRDIFYGSTSIGPHKDDISFFINGYDARDYGSQGQQRCAVLSSKLAEIQIIKNEKNTNPVLLLDDVLSELDEKRQSFLLESIKDIQVIITCTGVEDIIKKYNEGAKIFFVKNGNVENQETPPHIV
jgi:DNA replication and repair protein RecF